MTLIQDIGALVFLALLGICALGMWLAGDLPAAEAV